MIKTYNDKIYMTFGEGCYELGIDGGKLKSVCFGARVEPEDDMNALAFALSTAADRVGGDELCGGDRAYVAAEVLTEKPRGALPTLDGGNTLKVSLVDTERKIAYTLYYTTYARGAIARRAEIRNNGEKTVTIKELGIKFTLPTGFEILTECGVGAMIGNGVEAYGFLSVFGGETEFDAIGSDGDTCVTVRFAESVKLAAGETVSTPEVLAAYSDRGVDGVSRIFHDVLREYAVKDKRRRLVVECDGQGDGKTVAARIAAVAEIGADTYVPTGLGIADFEKVSEACKAVGLGAGLRLDAVDLGGLPGFSEEFVGSDADGNRYFDLANERCAKFFENALTDSVEAHGVSFVAMPHSLPALPREKLFAYLRGQYGLMRALEDKFPELSIEGSCGDVGALNYAAAVYCESRDALRYSVYFPPCVLAVRVRGAAALKTEFDCASLYGLGYALDPAALSEQLRRAVRAQVFCYQDEAKLIIGGDYYRGADIAVSVSKDKSRAYAVYCRGNIGGVIKFCGLDAHNLYHVREIGKTFSGAALARYGIPACSVPEGETVSFHLRQVADYE